MNELLSVTLGVRPMTNHFVSIFRVRDLYEFLFVIVVVLVNVNILVRKMKNKN